MATQSQSSDHEQGAPSNRRFIGVIVCERAACMARDDDVGGQNIDSVQSARDKADASLNQCLVHFRNASWSCVRPELPPA
jgi:hypothetical protein